MIERKRKCWRCLGTGVLKARLAKREDDCNICGGTGFLIVKLQAPDLAHGHADLDEQDEP